MKNLIIKNLSIAASGMGSQASAFDSFVGGNAADLRYGGGFAAAPWHPASVECTQAHQGRSGLLGMIMEDTMIVEQPTVRPLATKRQISALAPYPWRPPV